MSDTERFYIAIRDKMGGTRDWHSLHPMEQHQFIQAINIIIGLTQGVPVND